MSKRPKEVLYDGLPAADRIAELEEAVRCLEGEANDLKAENAKYADLKLEYDRGGVAETITRLQVILAAKDKAFYGESEKAAAWRRKAEYWKKEAIKLGWSRDAIIDVATGEVSPIWR